MKNGGKICPPFLNNSNERLNMEKTFVYMVSDEDYSPIFVLEAEEPFISNLKMERHLDI